MILRSNITVAPRFQKLWVLISALDSAVTSTCHGILANTADPIPVRPLPPPPWYSLTMSMPPSAVSPSFLALALVLSPMYCPTVDFRFVGYRSRDKGPGSKVASILCSVFFLRQHESPFWELYDRINRELITTTITCCGDVLRHQPISEANIIPEFLLRQLRAVKEMGYSTNPRPVTCCPM